MAICKPCHAAGGWWNVGETIKGRGKKSLTRSDEVNIELERCEDWNGMKDDDCKCDEHLMYQPCWYYIYDNTKVLGWCCHRYSSSERGTCGQNQPDIILLREFSRNCDPKGSSKVTVSLNDSSRILSGLFWWRNPHVSALDLFTLVIWTKVGDAKKT